MGLESLVQGLARALGIGKKDALSEAELIMQKPEVHKAWLDFESAIAAKASESIMKRCITELGNPVRTANDNGYGRMVSSGTSKVINVSISIRVSVVSFSHDARG